MIRPVWSSQTRKRAKTRTPLRFSEMKRSDGALLPGVVVVVVVVVVFVTVVVVEVTVPEAFEVAVVWPAGAMSGHESPEPVTDIRAPDAVGRAGCAGDVDAPSDVR